MQFVLRPVLFALALIIFCGCSDSSLSLHTIEGQTMGTNFSVKILKTDRADSLARYDEIEAEIQKILTEVNRQMSTYMEDSEISRFNRYRQTDWFPISEDFTAVLEEALKISELSGGAFDITVGPLVNLWGFGPEERDSLMPGDAEIKERQALTGYRKISVRLSPPAVKKEQPEIYCDLSAIAKGFGVDKIAGYLESLGIKDYMVEIGGEVRSGGRSHQTTGWRIGVQTPDAPGGIRKVIELKDISVATSGDYWNYFEKDGVRYSHTIDPRTGRPITHKLASVTVIHKSCTIADGMATAVDVLGPEAGYEFAVRQELPVLMIVREKSGFIEKTTPGFERFFPGK